MALKEGAILAISFIFLTIVLFAPQVLAVSLNMGVQFVEVLIKMIFIIPWLFQYIMGFIIWVTFSAIDYLLEGIYDTLAFWDSGASQRDDVPNLGDVGKDIMNDAINRINNTQIYLGRVSVPQRSFAQAIVDAIASFGIPTQIAWFVFAFFFAIITYLYIQVLLKVK